MHAIVAYEKVVGIHLLHAFHSRLPARNALGLPKPTHRQRALRAMDSCDKAAQASRELLQGCHGRP